MSAKTLNAPVKTHECTDLRPNSPGSPFLKCGSCGALWADDVLARPRVMRPGRKSRRNSYARRPNADRSKQRTGAV